MRRSGLRKIVWRWAFAGWLAVATVVMCAAGAQASIGSEVGSLAVPNRSPAKQAVSAGTRSVAASFVVSHVTVTAAGSLAGSLERAAKSRSVRAVLQVRTDRRWATRATGALKRRAGSQAFSITWRGPSKGGAITARIEILAGRVVLARGAARRLRLVPSVVVHRRSRRGTVIDPSGDVLGVTGSPNSTQTVLLGSHARLPGVGATLVLPPSSRAPDGVLGVVTTLRKGPHGSHSLTTRPASLDDAYSSFSAKVDGDLDELEQGGGTAGSARAHSSDAAGLSFSCSDPSLDHSVTTKVDLSHVHLTAEITKQPSIYLLITGSPVFDLGLELSENVTCTAKASVPIPVADTGIVLELGPSFTFTAGGRVAADFVWTPHFTYGFLRSPSGNTDAHVFRSEGHVNFTGQASVKLSLALDASITLAGRVGIEGSIGPEITGKVEAQSAGASTCLTADADFHASLTAFADIFFTHWTYDLGDWTFGNTQIFQSCVAAAPVPPTRPPTPPSPVNEEGAVTIPGSPLNVSTGPEGQCQVSAPGTEGEFFPPESTIGDCGFFLAFPEGGAGQPAALRDSTSGFDGHAGPHGLDAYVPISQSGVLGTGSPTDPYAQVTVFGVVDYEGVEDARVTERTTYVNGTDQFVSTYSVKNLTGARLYFRAMYAGDLYVGGDDFGVGLLEEGPQRFLAGVNVGSGVAGGFAEAPGALPWSSYQEGCWDSTSEEDEEEDRCAGAEASDSGIWQTVESTVEQESAFDESIEPTYVDDGLGVEWDQFRANGLPAGGEQAFTIVSRS